MRIEKMVNKNENAVKWLKGLLWFGAIYHLLLGLGGMFGGDLAVKLAKLFFGFNLELTTQVSWILNPFGAYVLAFGAFMAIIATDPAKYKKLIYVVPAFIGLRVVQRLYFMFMASGDLVLSKPTNNIIDIILVAIFGIILLVFAKKIK